MTFRSLLPVVDTGDHILSVSATAIWGCRVAEVLKSKLKTLFFVVLFLLVFISDAIANTDAISEQKFYFDIPRQQADGALTALGQQADITVLYRYDVVNAYQTNQLIGEYTLGNAILFLLESTSLKAEFAPAGHLIITDRKQVRRGDHMKQKTSKTKIATGIFAAIASIFGGGVSGAVGQESSAPPARSLEEIVVTGVRASLSKALDQKRSAVGVVDSIAAEDIADFPDLNISESLQRITGVSINRVLGEGQQVSVRGLAPQFTRVTINGQTVTSGASGSPGSSRAARQIDFDIFASELFTNVSLAKTPSASLTEGGLAATIELRTARPFDFDDDGTIFAVSAKGTYNDMRADTSPRLSAVVSNNSFMGGKLGLLASVSYSESRLRRDAVEGFRFLLGDISNGSDTFTDVEIPFIPRYLLEQFDRDRLGITGAIQFKPTDNLDINLDVSYAEFDELRRRYSIDGLLRTRFPAVGPIEVDPTGLVTRVTFNGDNDGGVSSRSENLHSPKNEDLVLINFDTSWRFSDGWEAKFKFGYSDASSSEQETRFVYEARNAFTYNYSDRTFVQLIPGENTQDPGTIVDFTDASDFSHNQSRFINTDVADEDISFQADVTRDIDNSLFSSVSAGIRFSEREKSQVRFDGRFTNSPGALFATDAVTNGLPVNDFFSSSSSPNITRDFLVVDFDAAFADPELNGDSRGFVLPQQFINSFAITEETTGAYVQADMDGQLGNVPVRGNIGLRYITTDQTSEGFLSDGTPLSTPQSYSEVLPSLNLVAELNPELLLRFAASRSLTRPTLFSLSPGGTLAPTSLTATIGNPNLQPFTADQFDMSLEWYFAEEALASIAFFRKDVDSFITNVTSIGPVKTGGPLFDDAGRDVSNDLFTISGPVNGEGATVEGFELSLQTPFTFLPEPFDGLGAVLNYTYADSESTIEFNGQTITTLLPGQSQSSYNTIGYYEKGSLSLRLAYSWRDEYLSSVRASQTQRSNFTDASGQLDASIQYEIGENITLVFDALNILEEEESIFAERKDRVTRYAETGRFVSLGVRAKF